MREAPSIDYCVRPSVAHLSPISPRSFYYAGSFMMVLIFSGYFQQAQVWCDEEGVRAVCALRLRDRPHHLLLQQQTLPIRFHRHGQGQS